MGVGDAMRLADYGGAARASGLLGRGGESACLAFRLAAIDRVVGENNDSPRFGVFWGLLGGS